MLGTKVLNYNIHGYRYPLFLSAFSTSWSMFEKGFLQNGTVYFPTALILRLNTRHLTIPNLYYYLQSVITRELQQHVLILQYVHLHICEVLKISLFSVIFVSLLSCVIGFLRYISVLFIFQYQNSITVRFLWVINFPVADSHLDCYKRNMGAIITVGGQSFSRGTVTL